MHDLLSEKQFLLLYGESGSGKTSLALEYAYKMKDEMQDWNVQWLNASSKNKLFNDLFTLYEKIEGKIKKNTDVTFSLIADHIKCEFAKVKEKNLLFVLDNLIESITWTDEFIRTMPENIRVQVTSTSGLSLCKYENELSRIEVNCLSQENRETFVKVKFQKEITQQDLKLLENFLPYDLHLLSLCLNKGNSSLVLAEVLDDKGNFHIKMLKEIEKIISKEAWSLLEYFAYIDSDAIPEVLIENLLDKTQINDAITCLMDLGLAELFVNRNHKCLRIDRKTQYLMRRLYPNENTEKYVAHILFKEMPKIETYGIQDEIWDKAVILINHLAKMYRDQNDFKKAGNEIYAGLQEKIGRYNYYVRMGV